MRQLNGKMKVLQSQTKESLQRQNQHNEDLLTNQSWTFYVMLAELAAFLGIVAF